MQVRLDVRSLHITYVETHEHDHDKMMEYYLHAVPLVCQNQTVEEQLAHSTITQQLLDTKYQILQKYVTFAYPELVDQFEASWQKRERDKVKEVGKCSNCGASVPVEERGEIVCSSCGLVLGRGAFDQRPSFKDIQEGRVLSTRKRFSYDKRTHLEEWLRRAQGREDCRVPEHVLDSLREEARKERVPTHTLTEVNAKRYLKKLGYPKYYDNIPSILDSLGRPVLKLPAWVEEKLKWMFQQIQEPFLLYRGKHRKNFLSYSYAIRKFLLILHLPELAKRFPLLKSPEKLREQDIIFKRICMHMQQRDPTTDWKFYPSL